MVNADGEIVIPLSSGCTLRCGPGEEQSWGGYIRIHDPDGNEILHWSSTEWEEDPELVIGAAFAAAATSLEELTTGRVLEDGAWRYREYEPG